MVLFALLGHFICQSDGGFECSNPTLDRSGV